MLTDSDAGVFFDTLKPILPCDFGRVMSLQKIAESGRAFEIAECGQHAGQRFLRSDVKLSVFPCHYGCWIQSQRYNRFSLYSGDEKASAKL